MNSEKLLIIGCGDLGRRLADRVKGDFRRIIGIRRHIPPASVNDLVHYLSLDASDPENFARIASLSPDVVVITMTPSAFTDAGYQQAYVQVCRNLCQALQHHRISPCLIIFVSSTRVYAQHQGEWVDEMSPTRPDSFAGQRLLEAEQVIRESGFPHCILRFSGIYGPGRLRLVQQVRDGTVNRNSALTNRIHADDCAAVLAHVILLQKQGRTPEPLYLASDHQPVPMQEVVKWLAARLNVSPSRLPTSPAEERGKRCSNARLLASGFRFHYPDYRSGYCQLLGPGCPPSE